MKKNSLFFLAMMTVIVLAWCASKSSAPAPIEIPTEIPNTSATRTIEDRKACMRDHMPVCGLIRIKCAKEPCHTFPETFSNTCAMEDNPLAELLHTGACLPADMENAMTQMTQNTGNIWLANPASVNCEAKWWSLEIREGTGGQYGICKFENGKECEEWAFFRGNCSDK